MTGQDYINLASACSAFVAAALWLRASMVPTPPKLDIITIGDDGFGGELPLLFDGVARQSRWNKWAAGSAGIAALLQGIATVIARAAA